MTTDAAIDRDYLSPSSLRTYRRCGEQFRRRYVVGDIIPPNVAMLRGTGVHRGAAFNWLYKLEHREDRPIAAVVEHALDSFDAEWFGGVSLDTSTSKDVQRGEGRDQVARMTQALMERYAPRVLPKFVEERVRIEVPNCDYDLLGVLDLLDDDGALVDVKTKSKKAPDRDVHESQQLTTYALLAKQLTGAVPTSIQHVQLIDRSVTKTRKTPQVEGLIHQTKRTNADVAALTATFRTVANAIDEGAFPPAEVGAWCCSAKWCGYYKSCPYVSKDVDRRLATSQLTEEF